jgi:hypothetical protein
MKYRIRELHFLLRAVLWRKQVPDRKEEQEQLYRAANGVILVTRLDVADSDGGAGYAIELFISIGEEAHSSILDLVKVHDKRVVGAVVVWVAATLAEVCGGQRGSLP